MVRNAFEHEGERSCVIATLERLIRETPERSHSTGELSNLLMALKCVRDAPVQKEDWQCT